MSERNKPLVGSLLCLLLTFVIAWFFWWPGVAPSGLNPIIGGLLGAFAPTLAAIITLATVDGRAALRAALRQLIAWRVGWRWVLFVLAYPVALSLLTTLIARAFGAPWPDFNRPLFVTHYPLPPAARTVPFLLFLPFVFVQQTLIGSSMGEELGWRGYLLPRLQARWGATVASLIIGLAWGIWHWPLAHTAGNALADVPFAATLFGTLASAVVFTWVYNRTAGSLLPALLLHSAINMCGLFLAQASVSPWLSVVVGWLLPLWLIVRTAGRLGRPAAARVPQLGLAA